MKDKAPRLQSEDKKFCGCRSSLVHCLADTASLFQAPWCTGQGVIPFPSVALADDPGGEILCFAFKGLISEVYTERLVWTSKF